jgi:hypothetical protein
MKDGLKKQIRGQGQVTDNKESVVVKNVWYFDNDEIPGRAPTGVRRRGLNEGS